MKGPYYVLIKRYFNNFTDSDKRIKIDKITEFEKVRELNSTIPKRGFYYVIDTNNLYYYNEDDNWIILKNHNLNEALETKISELKNILDSI